MIPGAKCCLCLICVFFTLQPLCFSLTCLCWSAFIICCWCCWCCMNCWCCCCNNICCGCMGDCGGAFPRWPDGKGADCVLARGLWRGLLCKPLCRYTHYHGRLAVGWRRYSHGMVDMWQEGKVKSKTKHNNINTMYDYYHMQIPPDGYYIGLTWRHQLGYWKSEYLWGYSSATVWQQ